ncbi:Methyltransferase domain-containing protein [Desulfotomaculum arcticum]|uniref:Methyltransferase domain-containing protein n=1 Tax=Desulfotruncus arcticus DSM 17038 TaxID=1121424 RepID=A0A1I2VYJ9_9FIRM|nr:class I SAM-dependent methyltransferase [Desulfotruncus arcticus]SFG94275.1 Methyltransferase domain-containing protein [Desulfotomaculum arcticum] [Desulfotruncus arcticus DSM 17038]
MAIKQHYDNFLAKYYSWMFGEFDLKVRENIDLFKEFKLTPCLSGRALDLGCGSGFQSIALATLGFKVLSIDLSSVLVTELRERSVNCDIQVAQDDIINFPRYLQCERVEIVVCMGDTLTHLETFDKVVDLLEKVYQSLENSGSFILTFRDYGEELNGVNRFIPVQSDENRILTCFLEYQSGHINVYDIIYTKTEMGWKMTASSYKKLRIGVDWVKEKLQKLGFHLSYCELRKGLTTLVAVKQSWKQG